MNLAGAEIEFQEVEDKEKLLSNCLNQVRDTYDFILIDCPPSLNILTINALTAADTVLVPIPVSYTHLDVYKRQALEEALKSLEMVRGSIEDQMPEDFYSIDLMDAYEQLGLIIGEAVDDDLVNEIFARFCMGK